MLHALLCPCHAYNTTTPTVNKSTFAPRASRLHYDLTATNENHKQGNEPQ